MIGLLLLAGFSSVPVTLQVSGEVCAKQALAQKLQVELGTPVREVERSADVEVLFSSDVAGVGATVRGWTEGQYVATSCAALEATLVEVLAIRLLPIVRPPESNVVPDVAPRTPRAVKTKAQTWFVSGAFGARAGLQPGLTLGPRLGVGYQRGELSFRVRAEFDLASDLELIRDARVRFQGSYGVLEGCLHPKRVWAACLGLSLGVQQVRGENLVNPARENELVVSVLGQLRRELWRSAGFSVAPFLGGGLRATSLDLEVSDVRVYSASIAWAEFGVSSDFSFLGG